MALSLLVGSFAIMAAHPAAAATPQGDVLDQSALGDGDAQFRSLFATWTKQAPVSAPVGKVSIPSRMPVEKIRLSSGFGMREHPVIGGRRAHKGIDLAAPTGTPVYATADGKVEMAQWFSSYGKFVKIEHGADLETRYAHLSGYTVSPGQTVHKGDLIGYVGSTGRSTGPHLHYEVRVAGEAVNPMPYMVETEAQQAFAMVRDTGRAIGGSE
ncbi:MAG: M23 family metallopeptidase [Novosphingobium sp.]|nr:M23 family metallopeptidase [Novosphingobium sp.]